MPKSELLRILQAVVAVISAYDLSDAESMALFRAAAEAICHKRKRKSL